MLGEILTFSGVKSKAGDMFAARTSHETPAMKVEKVAQQMKRLSLAKAL